MQRAVKATLASLLTLLLFGATGARAEDEILKLVPEQALGFVVVNRPAEADAKLQQLGRQMKLPIPSLLAKLRGPGGIHEGLDQNRPMAMLAMPPKDDKSFPTMIALIPVSDYAKFLEQFKSEGTEGGVTKVQVWRRPVGGPRHRRLRSDYRLVLTRGPGKDVKLADEVPAALAPWRTWLVGQGRGPGHAGAGNPLALGQGAAGDRRPSSRALAQAGGQMKQAAAGLDIYVMLFQATEKEVASVGFGVKRDSDGVLRLAKRARLVPGGELGRVSRGAKAGEAQRPHRAAGWALRLRRRRTALRGDDAQADGFLFRHDEEPARSVRAERGTEQNALRAWPREVPGNPRRFLRARGKPRAANRSLPASVGHHAGQEQS